MFSPTLVGKIAADVKAVWPEFKTDRFTTLIFDETWPQLELKQRVRHIAGCLRKVLPEQYPDALAILVRVTEKLLAREGENMSFTYIFLPDFVEVFGIGDPDHSLPALEVMTRWSSAEFAVRPFFLHYPERMYAQMLAWSKHSSPMVRRLSSEGFRPRLPWGMGVPALKKDPSPILPVLENLKNDPAETVRRSVANNLNDISKDHPALALDIARRWYGQSPETDWIVRHALRGLLKKGHSDALAHFGFEQNVAGIAVEALHCTPVVQIGGRLDFEFTVKNTAAHSAKIRLEYAIDYLTSSGKTSYKVFKIREMELGSGQSEDFRKYQRFTDFTTRVHYPGGHALRILVNGKAMAQALFEVI